MLKYCEIAVETLLCCNVSIINTCACCNYVNHCTALQERKNLHINDLMRNHESAFGQMKSYYNDITNDNLKLIRSLKDELLEMKKKAVANQKLMLDISSENKRLSEPLLVAVAEVADLRGQLKDQDKDRMSLTNAKARLRVHDDQVRSGTSSW